MFIQVVQGTCTRQDELRALGEAWRTEVSPGAVGWLGGTYGFTDDNIFIAVVRFESREAAMANSKRPEQSAWAERMTALMDGPVEFHDCDDVTTFLGGGSDDAGFVQVIRGKVEDPEPMKAMLADTTMLHEMRPEILGGTIAFEPDGTFTETVAFTDEASARKGEQRQPPADVQQAMAKVMEQMTQVMRDAVFYDLRSPWFHSPG